MRIKRVFVEKLFGHFDHDICMKTDDRITIIHAPNGFGKTTLLGMIDGLFNARYSELAMFPFAVFGVTLDDGRTVRVKKRNGTREKRKKGGEEPKHESLVFSCDNGSPYEYPLLPDENDLPFPVDMLEELIPDLYRVSPRRWRTADGDLLDLNEVLARYSDVFPMPPWKPQREPEWLIEMRAAIDVQFIRSDRLAVQPKVKANRSRTYKRRVLPTPVVMSYSEEVASAIGATLTTYAELSQSLDRTFPVRLVSRAGSTDLTNKEISQRLSEFEAKRERLVESGLLDRETGPQLQEPQTIDATNASALSVYVGDVQKKLAVFDMLAEKIDLFRSIINRRFKHKRMSVSKDKGITFTTDSGQPLSATNLSSGEQHEVVMLYELLFKVRQDSLILVDEPEISLHVVWQEEFLRDLQEMTRLSSFDVLIATHSPQIIGDRWDLTVELADTGELVQAVT